MEKEGSGLLIHVCELYSILLSSAILVRCQSIILKEELECLGVLTTEGKNQALGIKYLQKTLSDIITNIW